MASCALALSKGPQPAFMASNSYNGAFLSAWALLLGSPFNLPANQPELCLMGRACQASYTGPERCGSSDNKQHHCCVTA